MLPRCWLQWKLHWSKCISDLKPHYNSGICTASSGGSDFKIYKHNHGHGDEDEKPVQAGDKVDSTGISEQGKYQLR